MRDDGLTGRAAGVPHKGARGGEGGHPAGAAAPDLRGEADVSFVPLLPRAVLRGYAVHPRMAQRKLWRQMGREGDAKTEADAWSRADDKTAAEYGLEGGATLHLVLALRGGC